MIYRDNDYANGYGFTQEIFEEFIDLFYGFEDYYYYIELEHYKEYKQVLKLLNDIRNNNIQDNIKNIVLGWYILFKNSKRYLGKSYAISITDACQLQCLHCYNQNHIRENKYMSFDVFKTIYHEHNTLVKYFIHNKEENLFTTHISLLGGEPLLHPELYKIIDFINNNGDSINIETNGLIYDENVIKSLKNNKDNTVQISVDGLEEKHDFIRGKGTFKKTLENIKKYKEDGINIRVGIVANSYNYTDVPKIHNFFNKELGIKCGILRYVNKGNPYISPLLKKEQHEYLKNILPMKPGRRCNIGEQTMYDCEGNLLTCGKGNYPLIAHYKDTIEEKLKNIKKMALRARLIPTYCQDCKKVTSCFGGEMCSSFYDKKMRNIPDTTCLVLGCKEQTNLYNIEIPF